MSTIIEGGGNDVYFKKYHAVYRFERPWKFVRSTHDQTPILPWEKIYIGKDSFVMPQVDKYYFTKEEYMMLKLKGDI